MAKKDDLLDLAAKRFRAALTADQDERQNIDDDVRFAVDDDECQWPGEIKDKRKSATPARPYLTVNKIPEKIDQVEGEFKQLQPTIKVRAVDSKADPITADVIAGVIRHIEYDSDARSAYNTAHTSVLYGGRGAWRFDIVDCEDDPFVREIKINRIPNILSVVPDPAAKRADKGDMDYCFVTELIHKDEFKAKYGQGMAEWPDNTAWEEWRVDDYVRIAEYWYKEKVEKTYYRVNRTMNGVPNVMTVDELEPFEEPIDTVTKKVPWVKWCKMVAGKILEGPEEFKADFIPIFIESGKEVNVRGKNKTRGMVRFTKTSQRLYNYWTTAQTEMIALAPKVPYLLTGSMIGPYQEMWSRAHEENYTYLLYDIDPQSPTMAPRREPPPVMSSAYATEIARHEHDIMGAMGIYQASLGEASNEKSGRAIIARQRQGSIGAYAFIDSFRVAYSYSIKCLIKLIPKVYDTERIVRIIGDDAQEVAVPINARPQMPGMPAAVPPQLLSGPREGITNLVNDITVGKYDVAVSLGPSYTTLREETLAQLMELLKAVPQIGAAAMDLIVENMDLPHSQKLVKRLKKLIPPDIRGLEPGEQPPPPPPPDPNLIIEMKRVQMEMHEQLRKDFEAQVNAVLTLAKAEAAEKGQQMDSYIGIMQQMLKAMEIQKQPPPAPPEGEQGTPLQ